MNKDSNEQFSDFGETAVIAILSFIIPSFVIFYIFVMFFTIVKGGFFAYDVARGENPRLLMRAYAEQFSNNSDAIIRNIRTTLRIPS